MHIVNAEINIKDNMFIERHEFIMQPDINLQVSDIS